MSPSRTSSRSELKPWRLALVFVFGLLHGMGFAGVLSDLGLPRGEFLTALLSFNVGVEVGQLTVIALAALAGGLVSPSAWYHRRVVVPRRSRLRPSASIGRSCAPLALLGWADVAIPCRCRASPTAFRAVVAVLSRACHPASAILIIRIATIGSS